GPIVPPETLARLTSRFERAGATADGSGLGLAIVAAIAERIGSQLVLKSPRSGRGSGFEATVKLPTSVLDDSIGTSSVGKGN
ncbi:MAG: two-component sensor histidine kinase, partial [Rhizobiaceae bacterium]|nr:two-component sensor histidine kinase [Rhizobiaceae bacterium]